MDSINIVNLKIEKTKANLRYRRITALFRIVEFFVLLLMISRFSLPFPCSFKFSSEFFRPLFSPQFVFVIGNAIVVILVVKSGRLCSGNRATTDFCEEYVENSVKNHIVHEIESENQKKEDKIIEDNVNYGERRRIERTHSENLGRVGGEKEKMKHQLRRTVTEGRRKSTSAEVGSSPAEKMSNEEFRRKVEDFIARQQKSLREEEEFSAIVSSY
ncbi:uncharacterized protein LOC131307944 [Rhododendron vialii]|uniref:uncharacterized protein LOC131307944 n=1 Tax=Rhododendron vialii TaxID=182163 RepID=UPI00266016D0|nr:uncharacterized protein LOC131307944 [Rhododendron vialii]